MSTVQKNPGLTNDEFLAAGITVLGLTAVVVAIRMIADFRYYKHLYLDDYVSLSSLVFLSAGFGLTYHITLLFGEVPTEKSLYTLAQLAEASNTLLAFGMWSAKVPICLLYVRLFGVHNWLRWAAYGVIAFSGVAFLAGFSVTDTFCMPTHPLMPAELQLCEYRGTQMGVYLGVIAVACDLVILALPLPIILRLQMSFARKMRYTAVFSTGVLAIVASAVSLAYKCLAMEGKSVGLTTAMICTVIESCIAIIVGSAAGLYSFWAHFVVPSRLYATLSSAMSRTSSSKERSGGASDGSGSESGYGGRRVERIRHNGGVETKSYDSSPESMA